MKLGKTFSFRFIHFAFENSYLRIMMYSKRSLIHGFFLAICVQTMVCLKKDEYYCQMSSPCVCVSVDNNNIDLAGINISLSIGTNLTLNYQPCPDELGLKTVAVSNISCDFFFFGYLMMRSNKNNGNFKS